MDGDHRDDHDGDHERRADRPEQPERDEQSARDLGGGCQSREAATRTEPKVDEELARLREPVSSKPAEQLLRAVRRHHQTDHDSREQQSDVQCLRRQSLCIHGEPSYIDYSYDW